MRQLKNFIERLVVMSDAAHLDAAAVGRELARADAAPLSLASAPPVAAGDASREERRREAEKAGARRQELSAERERKPLRRPRGEAQAPPHPT